jgi:hypothetical protein
MSLSMTTHARARMQQRGICAEALRELLAVGTASPAGGGLEIVFFDRIERARLGQRTTCPLQGRDRLHRLYAITDGHGTVITVGHRFRRMARTHRGH